MKVSFDFGGTLERHRWLVKLALSLHKSGCEVLILTGLASDRYEQELRRRVDFCKKNGLTHIPMITVPCDREAPKAKADKCHLLGIDMHFDDSPAVIRSLEGTGTKGIKV